MTLVLDASATGPLLIPDESSALLPGLSDAVAGDSVHVPPHWFAEIANLLLVAARNDRIAAIDLDIADQTLAALPVTSDGEGLYHSSSAVWKLAERHRLTIYDAAYLALAARLSVPLATNDKALIRAAVAETMPLFGR